MIGTRWVVNIRYFRDDGSVGTTHVLCNNELDAKIVKIQFIEQAGPPPEPEDLTISEVPATWECTGRDGCMIN